jgi:hypothetical protein
MRSFMTYIVSAGLAGLFVSAASAQTQLTFNSQPGDFVGQGQQWTYTTASGTITPSRVSNGVRIAFTGFSSGPFWDLYFVAPQAGVLVPGIYESAQRYPFQSPTQPGLDVSGASRGCNTLSGRFVVLEAVYGAGGAVQSFAAEYEQHCEGGVPALFGSVRINSSVPAGLFLSVNSVSGYEGDASTRNLNFTVSLSGPSSSPVTVQYDSADSTGIAGTDYLAVAGTLTFPAGTTSRTVGVPIPGDVVPESNKTFFLNLSSAAGASIAFGQGTGTILDDEGPRTRLYFNSQTGDYIGAGIEQSFTPLDGNFTASRIGSGVEVRFAGKDSWTVSFVPPQSSPNLVPGVYTGAARYPFQTTSQPGLDVSGAGRGCNTLSGRFVVFEAVYGSGGAVQSFAADFEQHCEGGGPALFGSVRYAYNATSTAAVTLSVNDVTLVEGNSGSRPAIFSVSLSAPVASAVQVVCAAADGTAIVGSDYMAAGGNLTFESGATQARISVPVYGDTLPEPNETLFVNLSNPIGATLARASGTGTISNDDFMSLSIADVTRAEGGAGATTAFDFPVLLSAPSPTAVTVNYATSNGTAVAPGDYTSTSGVLTFAPGESVKTVHVLVKGDATVEPNETFNVALSNVNGAILSRSLAQGTIFNDDQANAVLSVDDGWVVEGHIGQTLLGFTLSLSAPTSKAVTVNYATSSGTAISGTDFVAASGTFTLPAGVTSKILVVRINGDTAIEANETVTLSLTGVTNAVLARGAATGTILDDDPASAAGTVPTWRLYHEGSKEHLYTTDLNEYTVLGTLGWNQEGQAFTMFSSAGLYNGAYTVPYFRLYDASSNQHLWTSDAYEAFVLSQAPTWFYEGIVGDLLPASAPGTKALYRLFLPSPPLHLWTADFNEYTVLPTFGWGQEGKVGEVLP